MVWEPRHHEGTSPYSQNMVAKIDHIISTLIVVVVVIVVTPTYPWKLSVDLRLFLSHPRFI